MEDQFQPEKWKGKVAMDLLSTNADQAWSLLSDFFSLNLWLPGIHTCEKVNGSDFIRYVTSPPGENGEPVHWAKEELIGIDPVERSFSYKVLENNMGFGEYVAHFRVSPSTDHDNGCSLKWWFECEPVNGWTREGLVGFLDSGLKGMAERVEVATKACADDHKLNGDANGDAN